MRPLQWHDRCNRAVVVQLRRLQRGWVFCLGFALLPACTVESNARLGSHASELALRCFTSTHAGDRALGEGQAPRATLYKATYCPRAQDDAEFTELTSLWMSDALCRRFSSIPCTQWEDAQAFESGFSGSDAGRTSFEIVDRQRFDNVTPGSNAYAYAATKEQIERKYLYIIGSKPRNRHEHQIALVESGWTLLESGLALERKAGVPVATSPFGLSYLVGTPRDDGTPYSAIDHILERHGAHASIDEPVSLTFTDSGTMNERRALVHRLDWIWRRGETGEEQKVVVPSDRDATADLVFVHAGDEAGLMKRRNRSAEPVYWVRFTIRRSHGYVITAHPHPGPTRCRAGTQPVMEEVLQTAP